jgi:two-component system phosphate regulon sensor histidine kinase PhoR
MSRYAIRDERDQTALWRGAMAHVTHGMSAMGQGKRLNKLFWTTLISALPTFAVLVFLVVDSDIDVTLAVFAAVFVCLVLAAITYWRSRDFDRVQTYVEGLSEGAATPPIPDVADERAKEILDAIETLHENWSRDTEQTAAAAAARETALQCLPDPVFLIDGRRRITFANEVASTVFGGPFTGRNLAVAVRDPAVLDAADAILAGREESLLVDITVPGAVERDFRVRVLALPSVASDGTVAVIVVRDMGAETRAERMRADFVANVSHELRTPLSALLGFVETLQGPAKDDAEARSRFLVFMHEQATRMARLIDDLLSLSRIELEEHRQPDDVIDAGRLITEVCTLVERRARRRRVTLDNRIGQDAPSVVGDRDQLVQVFENLVSNAVKYGDTDSVVTLSAVLPGDAGGRAGQLGIAIRDRGPGIPREHLPRLTERFYRVDSARSREMGGTGLGLAIVKHIVNRHRGQLAIESVTGEGSIFTVFLPTWKSGTAKKDFKNQ